MVRRTRFATPALNPRASGAPLRGRKPSAHMRGAVGGSARDRPAPAHLRRGDDATLVDRSTGASRRRRWSPRSAASTCARVSVALACLYAMHAAFVGAAWFASRARFAAHYLDDVGDWTDLVERPGVRETIRSLVRSGALPASVDRPSSASTSPPSAAATTPPPRSPASTPRASPSCRPSASTCRRAAGVVALRQVQAPPRRASRRGIFRRETFARWSRPWCFPRTRRRLRSPHRGEGAWFLAPRRGRRRQRRFPQQQLVQPRALGMVLRPRGTQPGDATPGARGAKPSSRS